MLGANRTVACASAALLACVLAWKLAGSSEPADMKTICEAEARSRLSIRQDMARVTQWTRERLETPEAQRFYAELRDEPFGQRALDLSNRARALGIPTCPMAATYGELTREAVYREDLQGLCSFVSFPGFEELDAPAQLDALEAWIREFARDSRTKVLAAALRESHTNRDRAALLRRVASEIDIVTCDTAKLLDASAEASCALP
jgi:hypothetical protein